MIEGGVVYFIRPDHIGRPVYATNASGVKVWTASYNPFGGVTTSTGTVPANRFPGQWFQSESGLHQNWMRDYDPTTGRYLQADPLGLVDGASVYGYVKQNPGRWVDPRGLFAGDPENVPPYQPMQNTILEGGAGGGYGGGGGNPDFGIIAAIGALLGINAVENSIVPEQQSQAASAIDCCEAEREALREAKRNNPGQCLASDSLATLEFKLARLSELLDARKAAFECIGDGDPEHQRQINDVQKMVTECLRRLGQ